MRILLGHDGSQCADAAIEDLLRAGLPEKGEALVVAVADVAPTRACRPESVEEQVVQAARDCAVEDATTWARKGAERLAALLPGWTVAPRVELDSPARALLGTASFWNADLLVVGSHGRSALGRAVFGSVSQQVLHHAPCGVRIARGRPASERPGGVRIVVGVDGSPGGDAAVAAVRARRWPAGSAARVVTAVNPATSSDFDGDDAADPKQRLRAANRDVAASLKRSGLDATPLVVERDAKRALVEEAADWGADCVFVGEHGLHGAVRAILGSVAAAVAARAPCSVEVVRAGLGVVAPTSRDAARPL